MSTIIKQELIDDVITEGAAGDKNKLQDDER